ncbi:hypothetical protein [Desulfoluna sp.]|uniref:hypothetical protein n=1 Tax=Desulfoluna sp. TaxID=2045199 RepID=UPI0026121540|nr:hypothetical protein [Desulfoluna sp.]
MLDTLISNQDRHHENWGFIEDHTQKISYLAPTYDHASSLGCRISDEEIERRLNTNDKRFKVSAYVKKATTPFFTEIDGAHKRLKTIDAFKMSASRHNDAAKYWLEKLDMITDLQFEDIFSKISKELITESSIKFALAILKENKLILLNSEI